VVYDGDPWLFSLSKNKHRRHMSLDQIAMVAAQLVTTAQGGDRRSETFKTSNEGLKVADAAKTAAVPKTAIESAKVVLKHGTAQEKADVRAGKAKLRRTADAVRARRQRPATPRGKKTPVQSGDSSVDVLWEVIAKCADNEWRALDKMALTTRFAPTAIKDALKRLRDALQTRGTDNGEYRLDSLLVRLVNKPSGTLQ
jgi:hypothetical protein